MLSQRSWEHMLVALEAGATELESALQDLDRIDAFLARDPVELPDSMPPLPGEMALRAMALSRRMQRLETALQQRLAETGRELSAMARTATPASAPSEPRYVDLSA